MKLPNKVNTLTDLAEFLKTLEHDQYKTLQNGFNMRDPDACIGGWLRRIKNVEGFTFKKLVLELDPSLDELQAHLLCFPEHPEAWSATPHQAARAVEILRDTGKCDWERAMKEA